MVYIDDVDENNSALYRSPQVSEVLGYEPREFEANPGLWRELLHPEDRERVLARNERTNRTGEAFSIEYRMISRDGRAVWLHDEAILIKNEAGEPLYWQGFFQDISARKRAEQERQESEERYRTWSSRSPRSSTSTPSGKTARAPT